MKTDEAMLHLAAYKSEGQPEVKTTRALKAIENDSVARGTLEEQLAFDERMRQTIGEIVPPNDLRDRIKSNPAHLTQKKRGGEGITAILSVIVGVLILCGLIAFFYWEGRKNFTGKEELVRLVNSADGNSGADLAFVSNVPLSSLADWFYMRGFDGFEVPVELRKVPVAGTRTFRSSGKLIAQAAVEAHTSLIYVFKGNDLGLTLAAEDDWRIFQAEDRVAAVKRTGEVFTMITFEGSEAEMHEYLAELKKSP